MLINIYAIGFVGWAIFFVVAFHPFFVRNVNLYSHLTHYLFAVLAIIFWPIFTVVFLYTLIADRCLKRTGR